MFSSLKRPHSLLTMLLCQVARLACRFGDVSANLSNFAEEFARFSRQHGTAAYGRKDRQGPSPSIQNHCAQCYDWVCFLANYLWKLGRPYLVESTLKMFHDFIHCCEDLLDQCDCLIHLLRRQKTRLFLEAAGQTPNNPKSSRQIAATVGWINEISIEAGRQFRHIYDNVPGVRPPPNEHVVVRPRKAPLDER